jgi:EAL domain-containing protein (putative c-di-GMP-specific phosphodiesterase class I)
MDAHEREVDTLIQRADLAMYEGRREGRGNVTWFVERMRTEREEERALVDDLEAAVDHGGIVCAFQPIVRLSDQRVDAVEALARWQHPERGPVPPADFVPLAESAGLVERLDQRMLERSLAQVEQWRAGGRELAVHVNVSGRSIRHDRPHRIAVALAAVRLPAEALAIEVTESWLIRNELEVAEILAEVAGLGVRIHLDDFGTGYSSMAHIYALPIWGLKIDRSFVLDALQSERSRRLIAATIGMAHSLDLEVIAEGVETQAVADILCDLGCDYAQGYLYAPPPPRQAQPNLQARPPWSRPEA